MSDDKRIFCSWQVAEDGSGDIIINIPPEIADALKLQVGDVLTIEMVDGLITL
ncbi:AbrB/MazE/SpoVT family DNA-binding domain-containing protein [Pseudomonas sp.]|jgi:antitoxin ChpS|uniref:AbrB/MazE/SpoVT family DNA-binding domain-containing protein n=1 Tax=Pseudomonas sp. TaxID=306 RepID=UPI003FD80EC5